MVCVPQQGHVSASDTEQLLKHQIKLFEKSHSSDLVPKITEKSDYSPIHPFTYFPSAHYMLGTREGAGDTALNTTRSG